MEMPVVSFIRLRFKRGGSFLIKLLKVSIRSSSEHAEKLLFIAIYSIKHLEGSSLSAIVQTHKGQPESTNKKFIR